VVRTGARRLSLFHRLGITLVILGMMQSLAPTCFRPARSSLRLLNRLTIAIALRDVVDPVAPLPMTGPTLPSPSGQDQESDQESHDTEDQAEALAWPEAMADHRSVQRMVSLAPLGGLPRPARAAERTRSALQQSRVLAIRAASSASMNSRLCRFTC